jgi:hypothetical protein
MGFETNMKQTPRAEEVQRDLSAHIGWCLSQYSVAENGQFEFESLQDEGFHPDWSALRTLQNHLHYFLGHAESQQSSAVASLLIFIIGRIFSDLCTDTPWDDKRVINNARKRAQDAILKLLLRFKSGLELPNDDVDRLLWQAFREFDKEYNAILAAVDKEDMATLQKLENMQLSH